MTYFECIGTLEWKRNALDDGDRVSAYSLSVDLTLEVSYTQTLGLNAHGKLRQKVSFKKRHEKSKTTMLPRNQRKYEVLLTPRIPKGTKHELL